MLDTKPGDVLIARNSKYDNDIGVFICECDSLMKRNETLDYSSKKQIVYEGFRCIKVTCGKVTWNRLSYDEKNC